MKVADPNMLEEKLENLKGILRSLESVIIAYSGGICRATEAAASMNEVLSQ